MSQLILRGVLIVDHLSYCSTAGQRTIEISMEADWSEPVCEAMGWTVEPKGFGSSSLDNKLNGINMILNPNKRDLKDAGFDIPISTVGHFKHKATVKDGATVDRKLTFKVTTVADDAYLVLENWHKLVGPSDSTAQCKINYNAETQMKLDDAPAETSEAETSEKQESPVLVEGPRRGRRRTFSATGDEAPVQ